MLNGKCFYCKAKKVYMYPPKAEHGDFGIPDYVTVDDEEISQERMPTECDEWKDEFEHYNGILESMINK